MVISDDNGLSVYCTQPEASDYSRESVFVSTFAGDYASRRFCDEHSFPDLLDHNVVISPDSLEARKIIDTLSAEYLAGNDLWTVQRRLEKESKRLVDQHWLAIEALATALLAKNPEPMSPLKTGQKWWHQDGMVRYMAGEEAVEILAQHGIAAV